MRASHTWTLVAVLLAAAATAAGQTIGKPAPDLEKVYERDENKNQFSSDEERFLIKDHRGHMLLLYFWRVSDLESVELRDEIKAIYEKYRPRGVRLIEMVTDNKERYDKFADGDSLGPIAPERYRNARVIQSYFGALSEPYIVIIDGRSIVRWRGHPLDRLEQRLERFLELYPPPAGDDAWLAGRLRDADRLAAQGELGRAFGAAKEVYDFTDEGSPRHGEAGAKMEELRNAAREWLKKALAHEQKREYDEAARIVAQVAVRFKDEDVAREAETEIGRMNGRRTLKEKIREATDMAKAEVLLDEAAQLEKAGDYEAAIALYKQVVKDFEDHDAADIAEKDLARIADDAEAQQAIAARRAERFAERYLDLAERFAAQELYEEAKSYRDKLLTEYPDSDAARRAKEWLKDLPA